MNANELKLRTKKFALNVISVTNTLPKSKVSDIIGYQIIKSATSVGANYRAACRALSQADFISKITIVEEEADETCYWLDLIAEAGLKKPDELTELMKEANELTAIFTASGKTAKSNKLTSTVRNPKSPIQNFQE